jgi:HSP20 family protein
MAEKMTDVARREGQQHGQPMTRRESPWAGPFASLERFADEIDNVFDDFGLGRNWLAPRFGRGWPRTARSGMDLFVPQLEVHQQNDELVIRTDLPGMKKEDVSIDVTDNAITISGERRQEQETERSGMYRSERSYGRFSRTLPLPEGALTDQAKATFKDGVLEVRMPTPPEQVTRGRRLEIKDAGETRK